MLFKQAARGDERVYLTVQNVDVSSITTGFGAVMRIGGSFNGITAALSRSATTADLPGFLGVASQDIAANSYGVIQVGGWAPSVWVSNVGTSLTINAGDPLVPGALAGGLFSAAPTYANSGFQYVLASNVNPAISATGYVSGWVRTTG